MVELRPSSVKLSGELASRFREHMDTVRFRPVDLIVRGAGREWLNTPTSVVFELRSPDLSELASLACVLGRLAPTSVDYMHACGEHCIVYWVDWTPATEGDK